eukprot:10475645-Heterocapsa_arctica.AAC.1
MPAMPSRRLQSEPQIWPPGEGSGGAAGDGPTVPRMLSSWCPVVVFGAHRRQHNCPIDYQFMAL